MCTTGHRDYQEKQEATCFVCRCLPRSHRPLHPAPTSHPFSECPGLASLETGHMPRRPCSMRGQRPPSVRTPGRKALASRGHSLPLVLSGSSYPRRPVPYADCTTSSSLVSLPCSAHLGSSPRRAGLGTWTPWIDSRSHPHNGTTGQKQGGYHRTPTWKGLDLGCRTLPSAGPLPAAAPRVS